MTGAPRLCAICVDRPALGWTEIDGRRYKVCGPCGLEPAPDVPFIEPTPPAAWYRADGRKWGVRNAVVRALIDRGGEGSSREVCEDLELPTGRVRDPVHKIMSRMVVAGELVVVDNTSDGGERVYRLAPGTRENETLSDRIIRAVAAVPDGGLLRLSDLAEAGGARATSHMGDLLRQIGAEYVRGRWRVRGEEAEQ